MKEKTQQTIKEQIKFLPLKMQEVVNLSNWENITEEIGKKYLLEDSELNNLKIEVALVLVALEDQDSFVWNVESKVGTTKEEAQIISNELDQKLFKPMVEKLNKNIKSDLKNKKITLQQNLDFILSGGDYSVFLETEIQPPVSPLSGGTNSSPDKGRQEGLNNKPKEDLLVNFLKNS